MQNAVSILLVDDQPRNLDVLESILSSPEYELVRAQSAEQALLELLHRDFAAIVLDIKMPGISGLELAQIIKKRRRTENIPILFLTAHLIEEQDVLRGYGAGAVDYLSKPINPDILRSKVAVFIDLYRKNRALAEVNRELQTEVDKRQRAQEELRQANERLESRVHERTEDLTLANDALRDSEQRVRLLLESVGEGIFGIDHSGRATFVNPAAASLLGYAPEELIGQAIGRQLPDPADQPSEEPAPEGASLHALNRPAHFFTRKDGTRFPVEFVRTPVRNDRGVVTGEVVVFRDLTARQRAARRLAAEHAVTRALSTAESLESAADEILSRLCETLDVSAAKLWIMDGEQVLCTHCRILDESDPQLIAFRREAVGTHLPMGRGLSGKVAQTGEPQWYGTLTGLSGLPWVDRAIAAGLHSALGFPVMDMGRCEAVITMYSRDVSPPDESLVAMVGSIGREVGAFVRRTRAENELRAHREQLEELVQQRTGALERSHERLRQAERLAAVGTLAAGLGHDMSNLLLPIRARLHSLAESGLAHSALGDVAAIGEAVGYLQRLASGLRLLAVDPDRVSDQNTGTNLGSWWRDVEGVFRAALPRGVRLEGSCPPDLSAVSIPAARLTQAVFNLVQNAGEALATAPGRGADKGLIRISARSMVGEPDGSVELVIEDDGPGMTPDVAARCFEPYFSTKTRVVSTGMGLAMVRAWVEGAGGSVSLHTAPGQGARFTLVLRPRASVPGEPGGRSPNTHAAITIEDKRTVSFVSVLIEAAHARALTWDQEGVPDAELWVVGGAAATPERVAAFLAQDGSRRAVVLEDLAPGARARGGHHGQIADPRVCYLGKKPGTSHLRKALVEALGVTRAQAPVPAETAQ